MRQKKTGQGRYPGASVEERVRAMLAAHCGKPAEAVDMTKPLSAPPLRMNPIDLAETMMTLEEEFRITIADDVIEKRIRFEQAVTKLTPADLITIVNESQANPPRETKK